MTMQHGGSLVSLPKRIFLNEAHAALVECIEIARERLADDDTRVITFTPNYRAAVSSGLAECWVA